MTVALLGKAVQFLRLRSSTNKDWLDLRLKKGRRNRRRSQQRCYETFGKETEDDK